MLTKAANEWYFYSTVFPSLKKFYKEISANGAGKAATTAASGIFTFHGENLEVDASMVGIATRKAIDAAVAEIVKKYRKIYKIK